MSYDSWKLAYPEDWDDRVYLIDFDYKTGGYIIFDAETDKEVARYDTYQEVKDLKIKNLRFI